MPHLDPFDHDDTADLLSPVPEGPAPVMPAAPLVEPTDDPRTTLAQILQRLIEAFGTDAGPQVDRVLTTLALALTRYVHTPYPMRAVVVGPTGSGKTRLLRTVASIVRLPGVVIPVTDISENGWRGSQIGEACRVLHPSLVLRDELARRLSVPTTTVALPSVVMLDELDKIALGSQATRFDGTAAAARIGKQHSLLPLLDPLSEMVVQLDDAPTPFRWSLKNSVVLCSGFFDAAPRDRPLTPADLVAAGLLQELVDRMGPVWTLPSPNEKMRACIARDSLRDVEAFASRLGVTVTGIEAWVATFPAPGAGAEFIGLRGLMHYVSQRVMTAVSDALTQQRTHIDLMEIHDGDGP